jgi:hypothetical protein
MVEGDINELGAEGFFGGKEELCMLRRLLIQQLQQLLATRVGRTV